MDEFHMTINAPRCIPPPESTAIRRALDDPAFRADLARAV
jgi:hypothetical protein